MDIGGTSPALSPASLSPVQSKEQVDSEEKNLQIAQQAEEEEEGAPPVAASASGAEEGRGTVVDLFA